MGAQEDMETMFNNAMIYNGEDTVFHQQAKSLLDITRQTIGYARKGIKDMRGRTAGSVRKHNAQFVAHEKADRDARRLAARYYPPQPLPCPPPRSLPLQYHSTDSIHIKWP